MRHENCKSMILSTGSYLPDMKVKSSDLMHEVRSSSIGIREDFFERATGIFERRFSTTHETHSFLAVSAADKAIKEAGIDPADLDMVIYCGIDAENAEPAAAIDVMRLIGAKNARGFDLSNACIGLFDGISVANAYIASGSAENILLCTAEKQSLVNYAAMHNLNSNLTREKFRQLMGAFTLGDAGGAILMSKARGDKGFKYMQFKSDPSQNHLCYIKLNGNDLEFAMEMETISNMMSIEHEIMFQDTCKTMNWSPSNIDKVFSHQVGAKTHKEIAKMTEKRLDCIPQTYKHYANLTSATPAVLLSENKLVPGENILLLGAGSGWTGCQMTMVA